MMIIVNAEVARMKNQKNKKDTMIINYTIVSNARNV